MLIKKEFYFVRHGQTDANIGEGSDKKRDSHKALDISLNSQGRKQANALAPLIASLPITTVFHSPLQRAKETKDLACSGLCVPHAEAPGLSECNQVIWDEMTLLRKEALLKKESAAYHFIERIRIEMNRLLLERGPVLIVAHGGTHLAACCLMDIKEHNWIIDNCVLTHFSIDSQARWTAKTVSLKPS